MDGKGYHYGYQASTISGGGSAISPRIHHDRGGKGHTPEFSGGENVKKWLYIIAIFYGLVIIAVAVVGIRSTLAATVINLVLLAGLIGLTAMYAYSTHKIAEATREQASEIKKQAYASTEMANEMREQRYDSVRPLIDIEIRELSGSFLFRLRNIGVGPTTNVHSGFIDRIAGGIRLKFVGAIAARETFPEEFELPLKQEGDNTTILVYYTDVYEHFFESKRELKITKDDLDMGILRTHKLTIEEYKELLSMLKTSPEKEQVND